MNYAVIIAGGVGSRVGANIPKQFIKVYGKPILAYTLESFQNHPAIDAIAVVCIEGWEDEVETYKEKYGISKMQWIVPGGNSGQESIRNGVFHLKDKINENDIVIIHDSVRPLVDESVLTDVIEVAQKYGNGVTSLPYNEQIFIIEDETSTKQYIPRETLRRVSTPQGYHFGELYNAYVEAFEKKIGIGNSSYTNTMYSDLGKTLYFAKGSDKNIKLTTPDDLAIFRGYLRAKDEQNEI